MQNPFTPFAPNFTLISLAPYHWIPYIGRPSFIVIHIMHHRCWIFNKLKACGSSVSTSLHHFSNSMIFKLRYVLWFPRHSAITCLIDYTIMKTWLLHALKKQKKIVWLYCHTRFIVVSGTKPTISLRYGFYF